MALRPLIAICGTTGVGKSNLAVELALRLKQGGSVNGWSGAKIINADSMQVYEGLDIITNKIPVEERKGIEHLLMDIKKPGEQYVVGQWVQDAIKLVSEFSFHSLMFPFDGSFSRMQKIDEIHKNNEIPIVVGGTSYWIQNLVFSDRLVSSPKPTATKSTHKTREELHHFTCKLTDPDLFQIFDSLPESPPSASKDGDFAYQLHTLLHAIDPVMASRWHWRDTRKVLRSLEIIKETGRKASDIVAEQALRTAVAEPRFVRPLE